MLLSEEEARDTFCHKSIGPKNPESEDDVTFCLGSDCAAWRWIFAEELHHKPTSVGYCGLAGKP